MRLKSTEGLIIWILLLIAIATGGFLRISFTFQAGFPPNDGGLFFTMTQDILDHHYVLPYFTTYNRANIPFAYSPGAFYLLALLNQFTKIELIDLFLFVPLVFSILSLFTIYPIAILILSSRRQALLSVYVFAIIHPAFTWPLMGGGVTRSPGIFFSLLAIFGTLMIAKHHKRWGYFLSVPAISLSGYFHPETALSTAAVMVLLFLFFERRFTTILHFIAIHFFAGDAFLAPYLIIVLNNHGLAPFRGAITSVGNSYKTAFSLLIIPLYTGETIFPVLAVIGGLGMLVCTASRWYLLLFWILLITIIDPRSVHRCVSLPISMVIAIGLDTLVMSGLQSFLERLPDSLEKGIQEGKSFFRRSSKFQYFAAALILLYAFILSVVQIQLPTSGVLSAGEREAFSWVSVNTTSDSSFLIYPAGTSWDRDWVSEWFPALTQRRSLLTVQGYEWVPSMYNEKVKTYEELSSCLNSEENCFQGYREKYTLTYDYILIPKRSHYYSPMKIELQGILKGCSLDFHNVDTDIYHCEKVKQEITIDKNGQQVRQVNR